MMEAGCSARRVARQLVRSDCVARRSWDQWIREMSLRTPSTDQSSRRPPHRKKCPRTANCFISRHPGTGSTFTRGLCVFSNHTKVAWLKDIWDRGAHYVCCPLTPTHRRFRMEWCGARGSWTVAEWNQVVFSDESRFNFSSDDKRVRVWKPSGERLDPAFALQRHTAPTTGVIVWGVIAYNTRSRLVLIRGTMTAQRYIHVILQPHVLPFMQRLPGGIFQQDIARPHTARVLQDCLRAVTTLPRSSRSPYLSPIEHIWDHLGR
ncbi:transposable element Tcb2 transposase [Trichonephila clavipes]|nr:transposable element Tcb2 transposase [Trichonephila clavipes]